MEYSREQLEQIFLQLPPDLKAALFSEVNAALIGQIAEKFQLPEEKISLLASQIGLVILGVLPPQNLSSEIKTVLNIDGQMASAITQEVNFKIFTPIRLSLKKIHGLATPEEISTGPLTSAPSPIVASKPSRPSTEPVAGLPPIPAPSISQPVPPSSPPLAGRPPMTAPTPSSLVTRPASPPPSATTPQKPIAPPPTTPFKPTPPPIPPISQPVPPPPRPKPFIPPRPITPPDVIIPKTITPPSPSYQRPAYEAPALSSKPITSSFVPPSTTAGPTTEKPSATSPKPPVSEPKPPAPTPSPPLKSQPLTSTPNLPAKNLEGQTTITPKPQTAVPTEPLDLAKINLNDLKGNVVDLKNLED